MLRGLSIHVSLLQVVLLGLHAHLNSLFAHLIEFNIHYNTIEDKETEVLQVGLPPVFSLIKKKFSAVSFFFSDIFTSKSFARSNVFSRLDFLGDVR
jgi:hypothetical protein